MFEIIRRIKTKCNKSRQNTRNFPAPSELYKRKSMREGRIKKFFLKNQETQTGRGHPWIPGPKTEYRFLFLLGLFFSGDLYWLVHRNLSLVFLHLNGDVLWNLALEGILISSFVGMISMSHTLSMSHTHVMYSNIARDLSGLFNVQCPIYMHTMYSHACYAYY